MLPSNTSHPPWNHWPAVPAVVIPSGCRYARHSHGGALALHGICGMAGFQRGSAMHALHGSSRRAVQLKCGPECPPRGCRTNCSTTSHTHHPGGLRPAGAVVCRIRLQCAGWGGVSHTQSHAVATPTCRVSVAIPGKTHSATGLLAAIHDGRNAKGVECRRKNKKPKRRQRGR